MATSTKLSRQAQLRAILAGIAKRYAGVTSFTLGGRDVAVADLVKLIQTDLDGLDAIAKAKAAYGQTVQEERATRASLSPLLRFLRNFVLATLGDTQASVAALQDFGFTPRKTTKSTSATKAQAQEKGKATRKARGTQSKKAKAKIKGTLPVPAASPAPGGSASPKA